MLVAGTCAGLAAASSGATGVAQLLPAALATLPAVLLCAAVTVALVGAVPRLSALAWGLLALFLLIGEFGVLLRLPGWALGISPFDHLGSLPGGDADAPGLVGLVVLAAVLTGVGGAAFRRRDLTA
jgi:ABC-2 type transport system permease protein